MASAIPFASKVVNPLPWLTVSEPQLDSLREHIQVLPTLFRVLAALCFLPVAFLAFADVIGWAFFKLVLRPLGYASTIRFKDPEPPAFISTLSSGPGTDTSPPSSASSDVSNSPISSPASATTSLPPIDDALNHSARQSSSSSRSKSRSRTRKASISSASDGETIYTSKSMNRHRAPSIGFDGPLFGEDTTDGEAQTPGVESDAGGGRGGSSDYFAGGGGTLRNGPPAVGPRRTSTLQPSLSFTKAKGD
ncbi:uncharacterized protein JCM6883_000955 [Sporobolomyces salmoneus]|uniref:uncharacterized protein n=1 Tax=Sporobolomyces salmoneus TaxID=183962 RepID=UPI003170B342